MSSFDITAKLSQPEEMTDSSSTLLEQEQCVSAVSPLSDRCSLAQETTPTTDSCEQLIGNFISNLLKYGVFTASAVVLWGGVLYLTAYWDEPANYQFFQGEPSAFCSPIEVIKAALSGNPLGIIQLGLLLLIATPVVRVAFSLLVFLWQRDILYIMVTLLVLSGLSFSFLAAYF